MTLNQTLILDLVIAGLSFIAIWFKLELRLISLNKIDLEQKKRDSFKNLLEVHQDLILGKHLGNKSSTEWVEKYSEMAINLLLWGSDAIIYEYGNYANIRMHEKVKFTEREYHFANAVLAFRKELGYKNKRHRISADQIILIFRVGYDKEI